jgi:hypothetical protein
MYHSGHFFGLISAYNPNVTNKVTVSKTELALPIAMEFRVLNMSTNDKVGTTISGGGGVNLISADAFVEIPLAKISSWISLRVALLRLINTHF